MKEYLDRLGLSLYHDLLQYELTKIALEATTTQEVLNIIKYGQREVVYADSVNNFPATGEDDYIYVDTTTGLTYEWKNNEYSLKTLDLSDQQSDWNENNTSSIKYIQNKPTVYNLSEIQNIIKYGQADVSELTDEQKAALEEAQSQSSGYAKTIDLDEYGKTINYDSNTNMIQLKNGNTVLSQFSAAAFIQDGMVSDVEVKNVTISGEPTKCLVITFNSDSGEQPIAIPVSDLFDPNNYYDREEIDEIKDAISIDVSDNNAKDFVEIAGLKWATKNIGANDITDAGLYFQWGDITGHADASDTNFDWINYRFGISAELTKYNDTDNKKVLDLIDDAASSIWGGSWKIPTKAEIEALLEATNAQWTSDYEESGVAGLILTDKTDNTKKLFFPAVGKYSEDDLTAGGFYWTSELDGTDVTKSTLLTFSSEGQDIDVTDIRVLGLPIRPVINVSEHKQLGSTITEEERAAWNNKADKGEMSGYVTTQTFETYKDNWTDKERTISASLNDLNKRIIELEEAIANI